MELKFRTLTLDDVDCRVSRATEKGVSLLLYKNARVDMAILDEAVGPMNWQRRHSRENANCTIDIWDSDKKMWVSKEDTGTESNTEAQKGLASDSFKRAGFNWGIGRELYTAPFIWVSSQNCTVKDSGRKTNYGKPIFACDDHFAVSSMEVNAGKITQLTISLKGREVFGFGEKAGESVIACQSCGKPIKPVKKTDGTIWNASDISEWSKAKYGKSLCAACVKLASKAEG